MKYPLIVFLCGLIYLSISTIYTEITFASYCKGIYFNTRQSEQQSTDPRMPYLLLLPRPYMCRYDLEIENTYSQAHQDVVVYGLFPKDKGFFIEIGAFDGQTFSNTLWLERKHNWNGLLIEANPSLCIKIDKMKRQAWRLCTCISSNKYAHCLPIGGQGKVAKYKGTHQKKLITDDMSITVPCLNLFHVLREIKVSNVNYFSLDVKGAELNILENIRHDLKSGNIIVDVWTIEYRVWDSHGVNINVSMHNLIGLRTFFKDIGGYEELEYLSNDEHTEAGLALDVVFVNSNKWCESHDILPNGSNC